MSRRSRERAGATPGVTKGRSTRTVPRPALTRSTPPAARRGGLSARKWALVGSGIAIVLVALVLGWSFASNRSGSSVTGTGPDGTIVQASGGQWVNITPEKLASMLKQKDFALLNVKVPYSGEIAGTDLYIPYTDVKARAQDLPADKTAKIVVYCRSGHESAIAAQSLVDLGYTNIDNLDGGMTAWTASGGQLIQVVR